MLVSKGNVDKMPICIKYNNNNAPQLDTGIAVDTELVQKLGHPSHGHKIGKQGH